MARDSPDSQIALIRGFAAFLRFDLYLSASTVLPGRLKIRLWKEVLDVYSINTINSDNQVKFLEYLVLGVTDSLVFLLRQSLFPLTAPRDPVSWSTDSHWSAPGYGPMYWTHSFPVSPFCIIVIIILESMKGYFKITERKEEPVECQVCKRWNEKRLKY